MDTPENSDRSDPVEETWETNAASVGNLERMYTAQWWKASPVEVRAGGDGRTIGGYAMKFDTYSENLGGYVERIAPSFPNRSRSEGWPGLVCRYNHNDELLLGSTRSGTLRVSVDETGLFYEVNVPQCRGDVLEMVSRGDIAHSSFAFQVCEQEWGTSEQNYPVRTLVSGRLVDVAPVSTPAYRDTSVGLRSLAEFLDVPLEDVLKVAHENCQGGDHRHCGDELRRFFIRTDDGEPQAKKKPPMSGAQAKMRLLGKRPEDPIGRK